MCALIHKWVLSEHFNDTTLIVGHICLADMYSSSYLLIIELSVLTEFLTLSDDFLTIFSNMGPA